MEKRNNKITTGTCKCFYTPVGDYALEGYDLNGIYRFEKVKTTKIYYRIYPVDTVKYYETCKPAIFKKFFKIIKEYIVVKIKNPDKPWSESTIKLKSEKL